MSTHLFFSSVFTETHPELIDLEESFAKLKIGYQSNSDNNEDKSIVLIEGEEDDDNDDGVNETETLSEELKEKFEKIYNKNIIIDDEFMISEEEIDYDISDYVEKVLKRDCCQDECLKNKLDITNVKTRYKSFIGLKKIEQDSFLKGILSASLRSETTTRKEKRKKLANVYFFDGTVICKPAFMCIYGLGKTRWQNIRNHFNEFDIKLRVNALSGKVSNRAVPFDNILKIIMFILNYSDIKGLPSPGKCNLV